MPTQCAPGSGDTASYWTPALYRNGVKVDPAGAGTRQQIYYDRSNLASGTRVEVIPADLRVKTGLSTARTMAENPEVGREIYWGCSDNSTKGKATVPLAHCPTGIITLHVGFPNCWGGVLTHVDDTAHLAYPKGGRCLAPFGHPLPRVILRWGYPVGRDTGLVTLASGSLTTIHGDFWNTWQQPSLARLVDGCINAGKDWAGPEGVVADGLVTTTAAPGAAPPRRPRRGRGDRHRRLRGTGPETVGLAAGVPGDRPGTPALLPASRGTARECRRVVRV